MTKQPWAKSMWLKVRVKQSELKTLRAYAEQESKTMSEVVREWIATLRKKLKRKPSGGE